MLTFLKLIATYWKDIAIAIVLSFLLYVVFAWWSSNAEINRLKNQINYYADANEQLLKQVNAFESSQLLAKQKLEQIQKERQEVISVLSKEINKIRNQPVPKDCASAVQYGIKYKGDLQWPGQQ